jgi:hypothetical protein
MFNACNNGSFISSGNSTVANWNKAFLYVTNGTFLQTESDTLATITNRGTTTTNSTTFDSDGNGITTIGGNLTVDSGTLFIDAVNSKIGIGTTTPDSKLEIIGDLEITTGSGITELKNNWSGGIYKSNAGGTEYPFLATHNLIIQGWNSGVVNNRDIVFVAGAVPTVRAVIAGSSGNIGIGTISPTSSLHINSSSGSGSFKLQNTTGSIQLFVNGTTGKVGIGTTIAKNELDVNGTITATFISADGMQDILTDSPPACSISNGGYHYFDGSMKEECYCNTTNYRQYDSMSLCS